MAEANEGYRRATRKYLENVAQQAQEQLERANRGEMLEPRLPFFKEQRPVSYADEYRTAITMLEQHMGDTLELDSDTAKELLEDKWPWRQQFLLQNAVYSASAARSPE